MERVALPDTFPQNFWKVAGNRASVHRRPSGAREATGPGVQSPLPRTVLGWHRILKEPLRQGLPPTPCPPPAICMHYEHGGTGGRTHGQTSSPTVPVAFWLRPVPWVPPFQQAAGHAMGSLPPTMYEVYYRKRLLC